MLSSRVCHKHVWGFGGQLRGSSVVDKFDESLRVVPLGLNSLGTVLKRCGV